MDMFDLFERIEGQRADADYAVADGRPEDAVVTLSLADCDALSIFLLKAYGITLKAPGGHQDISDLLAIGATAFAEEVA